MGDGGKALILFILLGLCFPPVGVVLLAYLAFCLVAGVVKGLLHLVKRSIPKPPVMTPVQRIDYDFLVGAGIKPF